MTYEYSVWFRVLEDGKPTVTTLVLTGQTSVESLMLLQLIVGSRKAFELVGKRQAIEAQGIIPI